MELIETSVPRTPYGQEHGEWAKLLDAVSDNAKDGYGFNGEWLTRGKPTVALEGAVVLECAGYRSKRDEQTGRKRLFVLHQFDGESWNAIARSDERDWALRLRDQAREAMGLT